MKNIVLLLLVLAAFCPRAAAQTDYVPSEANLEARESFSRDRFGIFIHWGIYSMLGQGEWVMQNKNIDYQEYPRLAAGFFPSKFDAGEWVSAIKASGARYITITSRHHDGFSMFKSAASAYNVVDATPFGRDVIGELAAECASQGIRLHLYYSHLDWGRTDFYPCGRTGLGTGRPDGGEWRHYLDFMNTQLTELLTSYGPIGAIWFDGVWDMDARPREDQPQIWNLYEQYELIHSLQPACLVGNNHHLLPFGGEDIQIFERDIPGRNDYGLSGQEISQLPLETCQTMNRSWGYNITDRQYKSSDELIRYLVMTAAKGANLLLNIGPRPDGTLPEEALERLRAIGSWLEANGESIYGTLAGPTGEQSWGVSTRKGDFVYLHVLDSEAGSIQLSLPGKVSAATLLDGTSLRYRQKADSLELQLPEREASCIDLIVKVKLK